MTFKEMEEKMERERDDRQKDGRDDQEQLESIHKLRMELDDERKLTKENIMKVEELLQSAAVLSVNRNFWFFGFG